MDTQIRTYSLVDTVTDTGWVEYSLKYTLEGQGMLLNLERVGFSKVYDVFALTPTCMIGPNLILPSYLSGPFNIISKLVRGIPDTTDYVMNIPKEDIMVVVTDVRLQRVFLLHFKDNFPHILGSRQLRVGVRMPQIPELRLLYRDYEFLEVVQEHLKPTPLVLERYAKYCTESDECIEKYGLPNIVSKYPIDGYWAGYARHVAFQALLERGTDAVVTRVAKYLRKCTNISVFTNPDFNEYRLARLARRYCGD